MPTPAQLDAAASTLRSQARGLPELIDPPAARAGCDVWQGPAQAQLWEQLRWWRGRLGRAADELFSTAQRLEDEARRIRAAELAERLREAEREQLRERAPGSALPGRMGVR